MRCHFFPLLLSAWMSDVCLLSFPLLTRGIKSGLICLYAESGSLDHLWWRKSHLGDMLRLFCSFNIGGGKGGRGGGAVNVRMPDLSWKGRGENATRSSSGKCYQEQLGKMLPGATQGTWDMNLILVDSMSRPALSFILPMGAHPSDFTLLPPSD